jgi:glycosyltransferase involved in cell wall biosynthesis
VNILMMTNTFTPHVGGVARSVASFTAAYRERGHRVMVVAPEFENMPTSEIDVIRVPALQHFNGSDFSVVLPAPGFLTSAVDDFEPDVIHSHHPFLLGGTALRMARYRQLPIIFTHHTMYEEYTHYVPGDSPALKQFVISLSTSYANLCDMVFAPSESVVHVLYQRGVETHIEIVPTGVDVGKFKTGGGAGFRAMMNIPQDAFVVGHVGRLAPEKNLDFLARALCRFLERNRKAHFLIVGQGPSEQTVRDIVEPAGLGDRVHTAGTLTRDALVSAYHAMDVFAFASKSETQGMVLTEAMAAGVPVVALDASGVREVVVDGRNGRLLRQETVDGFSDALQAVADLEPSARLRLGREARKTADEFSIDRCADHALNFYERASRRELFKHQWDIEPWSRTLALIDAEWNVVKGIAAAAEAALEVDQPPPDRP